jgi:hypothetical protein
MIEQAWNEYRGWARGARASALSPPMLLIASSTFWPSSRTPTTSSEMEVALRSSRTPHQPHRSYWPGSRMRWAWHDRLGATWRVRLPFGIVRFRLGRRFECFAYLPRPGGMLALQ